MLIITLTFIVMWVLKKIFPTPGGFIYMCVDMYARGLMHVGYGLVGCLRISNPGWKNLTFDVLCTIGFESENFLNF
jgi:hypothetical protein